MIERLDKKGTIRLLAAMRRQAERDIKIYGKKTKRGDYVGKNQFNSARYYLDNELPVIREVLEECFKEQ